MAQAVILPPFIGPYTFKETVGEGAFSVVKLVYHEELQRVFACKIIPKARFLYGEGRPRFEREIRINQQIHHPGIVGLIDILKDDFNYYVVIECCPNGELFRYIAERGRLKEQEARPLIRQLLEALEYLHQNRVAHRDLKPENILIGENGYVKISDFGLSRYVDENGLVKTPCGSLCYASPECLSRAPYDGRKNDIWSLGVTVFAMLTGQLPWTKKNQAQLFEQIRTANYTMPDFLSEDAKDFIKRMMEVDPYRRIEISAAYAHPFLRGVPDQTSRMQAVVSLVSLKKVDAFFSNQDMDDQDVTGGLSSADRKNSVHCSDIEKVKRGILDARGPTFTFRLKMGPVVRADSTKVVVPVRHKASSALTPSHRIVLQEHSLNSSKDVSKKPLETPESLRDVPKRPKVVPIGLLRKAVGQKRKVSQNTQSDT
jgi:serine/threonine protein kinase